MNATTVAVADEHWRIVETQRLTRSQFERWFVNRSVGLVIMEACGSAHHWARWLNSLSIEERLLPAQYVSNRSSTEVAETAGKEVRDHTPFDEAARDMHDPTPDAGYTTAGALPMGPQSIRLLPLWGSPYTQG